MKLSDRRSYSPRANLTLSALAGIGILCAILPEASYGEGWPWVSPYFSVKLHKFFSSSRQNFRPKPLVQELEKVRALGLANWMALGQSHPEWSVEELRNYSAHILKYDFPHAGCESSVSADGKVCDHLQKKLAELQELAKLREHSQRSTKVFHSNLHKKVEQAYHGNTKPSSSLVSHEK
jgi:hypothetical protein